MSVRKIHGAAAILALFAGGCDLVLGLEHRELYRPDGGGGSGATTATSTGVGGTGGASTVCKAGESSPCYSGPDGTKGMGICASGTRGCGPDGMWTACMGDVTPQQETCGKTTDENCDGFDCVQWAKIFGSLDYQDGNDVAIDSVGNIYFVGTFQGVFPLPTGTLSVPPNEVAAYLVKLAPNGKPVWGMPFSAPTGSVSLSTVAVDVDGNAFVGGAGSGAQQIGNTSVNAGAFVAKVSTAGKPMWAKGLTVDISACTLGTASDFVSSLSTTPQGDVVIGGNFCAPINFGDSTISAPPNTFSYYGFIAKLRGMDGSGKAADGYWGRSLCPAVGMEQERCEVSAVAVNADGDVYLAGDFSKTLTLAPGAVLLSNKGSADIFLVKLTPEGIPIWKQQLGDDTDQFPPRDLAVDSAGGAALVGFFNGSINFGAGDVAAPAEGIGYAVLYGPDKSFKWVNPVAATPRGVAGDAKGNIFVVGEFKGSVELGAGKLTSAGDNDAFVAKFGVAGKAAWTKGYGDVASDSISAVAVTSAGEPVVVGTTEGKIDFGNGPLMSAGSSDVFLAKLSP